MLANALHWVLLLSALMIASFLEIKHAFPGGSDGKGRTGFDPWVWKIPLEKGMATHSSIVAWRTPRTEEPGELQSMGSQRVWHNWATNRHAHFSTICCDFSWFPLRLLLNSYFPFSYMVLSLTIWCTHKARSIISIESTSLWSIPGKYWKIWWVNNCRTPPAFT